MLWQASLMREMPRLRARVLAETAWLRQPEPMPPEQALAREQAQQRAPQLF
jgi:hypothetical protein